MTTIAPIVVERLGPMSLSHVLGELDIGNCSELAGAIERAGEANTGPIIVAFVECTYVDTSGLTTLVEAHRSYGRRLHVVVTPESKIRRMFRATGLDRSLSMHDDFRVALAEASHPLAYG